MVSPYPTKEQRSLPKPTSDQIESWVRSHFDKVKERYSASKGQRCLLVNNPAEPSDSGFHVGIFPEECKVHDFRPEMDKYNGDFVRFIAQVRGYRWIDAYLEITGEASGTIEDMIHRAKTRLDAESKKVKAAAREKPMEIISMPKGFSPISDNPNKLCQMALSYLAKRQVSHEEAIKLKIHYGVNSICFPYYEYDELVYWQIRDITTKVFTFPEGGRGQEFIWNFDNLQTMGDVFITESIFNAIVIGNGGAAAGTANMSPQQIRKLKALQPGRIILCPDNDKAGIASIIHNFFALEAEAVFKKSNHNRILYAVPKQVKQDWNDYARDNDRLKDPEIVKREILSIAKPITIQERIAIGRRLTSLSAPRP